MFKFFVPAFVFLMASSSFAAPSTCYDLLVRDPNRTYSCDRLRSDTGTISTLSITFSPGLEGSPVFFADVNGIGLYCTCDSKGNLNKATFFEQKAFTCVMPNMPNALTIRGKVSGKDGIKVVNLQTYSMGAGSASNSVGKCLLSP